MHENRVDFERAARLQEYLARHVLNFIDDFPRISIENIEYVAGFDSSFTQTKQCAVAVVYSVREKKVIEKKFTCIDIKVPYIPGFLAFREVPGYVRVYNDLTVKPNVILVDGHGLTHPRAFGIATHLGLILDLPSIGVAKSRLYGTLVNIGDRVYIRAHGRIVGEIIRHKKTELYVSIGYKVRLEDAVNIVKNLLVEDTKLPIPLQVADEYSKIVKNKYCK